MLRLFMQTNGYRITKRTGYVQASAQKEDKKSARKRMEDGTSRKNRDILRYGPGRHSSPDVREREKTHAEKPAPVTHGPGTLGHIVRGMIVPPEKFSGK